MKSKFFNRVISVLLCSLMVTGLMSAALSAGAAVLPDDYETSAQYKDKTYQDLGILEDQYDLIEPINNLFPIISPNSKHDEPDDRVCFYKGSYQQVEKYLKNEGMTDGMSIVPPTKIKAEKFLGYSSYGYNERVATVAGRDVKAYMVAANAIMAGCEPHHTPFCIAFVEALSDPAYLASLSDGNLTPMMYVNGPASHQIGIDNTQGMTTEETNIAIGRFMEFALINFTDIQRNNAFGYVQPLVFSENDETCLKIGWEPHHVEEGYNLNDNIITATSFAMWGNNITPATDLPEEIMKVMAWDITEKNLGALGGASVEDNANTKRLIFITESVATALATKYKSKEALEGALVENARRPLWMRAYAYYYANTGGALSKSFETVYGELKGTPEENAKSTASPPWMNGITYANIDTVATMKKGNTDIIVTGDSSRNKTQVMPGGVAVNAEVKLSNTWDQLLTSINYFPQADYYLEAPDDTITPPSAVPSVLTNGDYRILDPATGSTYMNRSGRVYYESDTSTLYYYANGASSASSIVLDPDEYADFIAYLSNLGYNSSFTVNNGKFTAAVIRLSSNASKLSNNTVALTDRSFEGMSLTLHANNNSGSNSAGGLAKDGATVDLSDTVTSYTVNLDGAIVMGDQTDNDFVKLSGTTVTVDPTVKAGAKAIIGAKNSDDTYRTLTFVNGGDGTYKVTYNTAGTLLLTGSSVYLKGSFNNWGATDAFYKTGNDDIISVTKELAAGTYEFKIHKVGTDEWYSKDDTITDTVYRAALNKSSDTANLKLNATGGEYEFKYELSTNKLSVYHAASELPIIPLETQPETTAPTDDPTQVSTEAPTQEPTQAPTQAPQNLVYLNPAIWDGADATERFQLYVWGSGKTDQWLTATESNGYVAFEVPDGYTGGTFVRMDASKSANDWNSKWNQTVDVTLTGNFGKVYTITSWSDGTDGKSTGTWGELPTETPTEAPTEPVTEAPTSAPVTEPMLTSGYYLVGNMNDWSLNSDYLLTRISSKDPREYKISDVALTTTSEFKIVYTSNGSTISKWYPSGMDNNFGSNDEITANGKYAVTFRPDGDGEDTWFEKIIYAELTQADPTEAPTEQPTEALTAYFTSHSLSLNGDIGVNFYLDLTDEEAQQAVVNFSWDVNGKTKTDSIDLSNVTKGKNGYKATCRVAPAEMTCPVTAELMLNGVKADEDTYSAKQYADVILSDSFETQYTGTGSKSYANLKTLVQTMLSFGARAQEQFGVNTDDPADKDTGYTPAVVDAHSIQVTDRDMSENLSSCGLVYAGSTLLCLTETSVRHYYKITDQNAFDAVKDSVTINGAPVDYTEKNGEIYYEIKGIPAADLDTDYTLKIGTNEYSYSAMNYVKRALTSDKADDQVKALATSLYHYNQAADAYFDK